jgi:hypothetical protein
MESLKVTEAASAAVATGPRVTLDHIMASIDRIDFHRPEVCPHMTVAYVRMRNGFIVIGESAPADPKNFDAKLGEEFAKENAIRKIWQLEGYALRENFMREADPNRGIEVSIRLRPADPAEATSATDLGYIGASISYPAQPGEPWRRSNDLPDGPATSETLARILSATAERLGEHLDSEA